MLDTPAWSAPNGCLESQGCHFVPLSYLQARFSAMSSYFFCFVVFLLMVHSPGFFFRRNQTFFIKSCAICFHFFLFFLFGMVLAEQLGDDSWLVVYAACCHMAVIHLSSIFECFCLFGGFFFVFFFSFLLLYFGIDKWAGKLDDTACPSLICSFNSGR